MELKSIALTAILTTLLITRHVKSASDKGAEPFLVSASGSEEIGQSLHKSSIEEGTSSVPEVENHIVSSLEAQSFVRAMQRGYMDAARGIFENSNNELRKYCVEHLISLGSSRLVELINGADDDNREWILQVPLVHADQPLIDEVFGALNLSNWVLKDVAKSVDLACAPRGFINLLGKIDGKKDQEGAVENGVNALVLESRTEYIDPLLSALGGGTFLSNDLENIAIRGTFVTASNYKDVRTLHVKRLFDHPKISAEAYSDALYASYNQGGQAKLLFYWLLPRADHQDIEAVKRDFRFSV